MKSLVYITHNCCQKHKLSDQHPECPERLQAIESQLTEDGLFQLMERMEAPRVLDEHIARAHPLSHIERLKELSPSDETYVSIDGDTAMNNHSLEAIYRAAGAGVLAVDTVMGQQVQRAFCAVRPPGHHAEKTTAMGFCFLGNVAIAAMHAIEHYDLSRIAIIDFDVHHGNGTEDLVRGKREILLFSSFQYPLYPGYYLPNRAMQRLNSPLDSGANGTDFRAIVEAEWLPTLSAFSPELIIISAGFDAHKEDPLGGLNLDESDFAWITARIIEQANKSAEGRIISMLEGGYHLTALGRCVSAHLKELSENYYK